MGTISNVRVEEVPGGLFPLDHWIAIANDLLSAFIKNNPDLDWRHKLKPETRQWAEEYLAFKKAQTRLAKERALAKLTYDDKIALGLPT